MAHSRTVGKSTQSFNFVLHDIGQSIGAAEDMVFVGLLLCTSFDWMLRLEVRAGTHRTIASAP